MIDAELSRPLENPHGLGEYRLLQALVRVDGVHLDCLDLEGGQNCVDVGTYEQDWTNAYDYHWNVYPLRVHSSGDQKGSFIRPTAGKLVGCRAFETVCRC